VCNIPSHNPSFLLGTAHITAEFIGIVIYSPTPHPAYTQLSRCDDGVLSCISLLPDLLCHLSDHYTVYHCQCGKHVIITVAYISVDHRTIMFISNYTMLYTVQILAVIYSSFSDAAKKKFKKVIIHKR